MNDGPQTTSPLGSHLSPAALRDQIAEEIEAQREMCADHWPMPKGDCWLCQRHGALTRAARIARGPRSGPLEAREECSHCGAGTHYCHRETAETGERCCARCDCEEAVNAEYEWWRQSKLRDIHLDSLRGPDDVYKAYHGWVLWCLWCPAFSTGQTHGEALSGMQKHYNDVCGPAAGTVR